MEKLKKVSKKKIVAILFCVLVLTGIISTGIFAYYIDSDTAVNTVTIGGNRIEIVKGSEPSGDMSSDSDPYTNTFQIKNIDISDCYVRVKAVLSDSDMEKYCTVTWDTEDWITDTEDGYWYYPTPISQNELTSSMSVTVTVEEDAPEDKNYDVIIYAESYQSQGFADYEAAWSNYHKNAGNVTLDSLTGATPVSGEAGSITLTKRLKASEINFDNGNPAFLFKVAGTDSEDNTHVYYRMVTFNKDDLDSIDGNGYVSKSVSISGVAAGTYTATEEETSRYALDGISAVNGTVSGDAVTFAMSTDTIASAIFASRNYEQGGYSDSLSSGFTVALLGKEPETDPPIDEPLDPDEEPPEIPDDALEFTLIDGESVDYFMNLDSSYIGPGEQRFYDLWSNAQQYSRKIVFGRAEDYPDIHNKHGWNAAGSLEDPDNFSSMRHGIRMYQVADTTYFLLLPSAEFDQIILNVNCYRLFADWVSLETVQFDQDIIDNSYVYDVEGMFEGCVLLETADITFLDSSTYKVNTKNMFKGCEQLTTIYATNNFDYRRVDGQPSMFNGCVKLVGGAGTRYDQMPANNRDSYIYARIDGGPNNPGYFTLKGSSTNSASSYALPKRAQSAVPETAVPESTTARAAEPMAESTAQESATAQSTEPSTEATTTESTTVQSTNPSTEVATTESTTAQGANPSTKSSEAVVSTTESSVSDSSEDIKEADSSEISGEKDPDESEEMGLKDSLEDLESKE